MTSKRWLWAIALIPVATTLFGSCSSSSTGLKEYQQLTMEVQVPQPSAENKAASGPNELDYLAETEAVLTRRLDGFGIPSAEVTSTEDPERVIVRVPLDVDVDVARSVLTRRGQLYLRNEKPDTEEALSAEIESLQRLLVEQSTLLQTGDRAAAETLQSKIEQSRTAIANFFEPSKLTGERLQSAKAVREEGEVWAVQIQFDEAGSKLFAEQTKAMAGTGRVVGFFLDNVLLSTPTVSVDFVKTGITGGAALIAGNFTEQAAKDLEIQLNSGALPVYLKTVEVTSTEAKKEKDNREINSEKQERIDDKSKPTAAESK